MPYHLPGRVAVVTGASGDIGRAVSAQLIERGVHVFATTRAKTDRCHDNLTRALPGLAGALTCDLASEASCEQLVRSVVESRKRVDILVHCAGATQNKLTLTCSAADLQKMFELNAVAPILLAKQCVRNGGMLRGGGCCVAIGSVVGEDGNAGQVAYAASKGALSAAWKSMAREFGSRGVRFNVVAPGLVDSGMARALSEEQRAAWIKRTALGRLVTPQDVADAVVSCCEIEGITGKVVRVEC